MHKRDVMPLIKETWELRKKKNFREAELKLLEALELSPGNPLVEANLAEVYLMQGNLDEARKAALKALEKNPVQVHALTALGVTALEEGALAEAIENLQQALERAPNAYRAGRLARAYELNGEGEKALQILQQALEDHPGDRYLLKQYSGLKKKVQASAPPAGETLPGFSPEDETSLPYAEQMREKLRRLPPEKAAAQLQKTVRVGKRSQNPHLHSLLGDLWRQAERDGEAAAAYRSARELDPEDRYSLAHEAFCYRRLGRKMDAWPLLKQLLRQNPRDNAVKSAFLKDASELQRQAEAIELLEDILESRPHFRELYGAVKKLGKQIEGEERY